jgi:hypothetical protein
VSTFPQNGFVFSLIESDLLLLKMMLFPLKFWSNFTISLEEKYCLSFELEFSSLRKIYAKFGLNWAKVSIEVI